MVVGANVRDRDLGGFVAELHRGGVVTSTFVTLVVVPVLYRYFGSGAAAPVDPAEHLELAGR